MLVVINLTQKKIMLNDKGINLQGIDYNHLKRDPHLHFERIEFYNVNEFEYYDDIRREILKVFNDKSEIFHGTHGVLLLTDKLNKEVFLLLQELLLIKKFKNKKRKFFLHKIGNHIPIYVGIWDEKGNIEKIRIT